MLTLLALLSTIGSGVQPSESLAASPPAGPPVRLWMNNDRRFRPGDRVRLQVDADVDGYLLVLNYDTDGRVRVLFPQDPRDDSRVVAGRRYEVRDGGNESAFRASGDGTGLIFTAVSQDPWRFEQVVLADRWDYTRLEIDRETTNPEEDLSHLVQSIAGPQGFDYDVLGYRVYGESGYAYDRYGNTTNIYLHDSYLNCYAWNWPYSSCRGWPAGGWAFGTGYYYGYNRYGYGYGYGYPYGYPYGGYFPYRPGNYNRNNIVGRPRNYAVVPRNPNNGLGGFSGALPSGRNSGRDVRVPDIDWRTRARPSSGVTSRGPSGSSRAGRAPDAAPPARRARGDGPDYPVSRARGNQGNDRGRRDPSSYAPRGGNDGGRAAPPPRSEPSRSQPSRRDPPPAPKSEPSRSSGSGGGHSSPPPSRPRRP